MYVSSESPVFYRYDFIRDRHLRVRYFERIRTRVHYKNVKYGCWAHINV